MEIERLTNNADIIAVATLADDSVVPVVWRDRRLGPPPAVNWEIVLTSALIMYRRVHETVGHDGGCIRVIVGIHTVLVQQELGVAYGVVIETGHAVAKSLHRTIRRCAKPPSPGEVNPPAVDRTKPPPDYTVELWGVDGWVWWKGVIPSDVRGRILALLHHEPPCICGIEIDEAGAVAAAWASLGQATHLGAKA